MKLCFNGVRKSEKLQRWKDSVTTAIHFRETYVLNNSSFNRLIDSNWFLLWTWYAKINSNRYLKSAFCRTSRQPIQVGFFEEQHYPANTIFNTFRRRNQQANMWKCWMVSASFRRSCIFCFRATPHNSASRFGERFFAKSRFEKCRNTVCISSFSNRRIGGKDPAKRVDAIMRCCLRKSFEQPSSSDECQVFCITGYT